MEQKYSNNKLLFFVLLIFVAEGVLFFSGNFKSNLELINAERKTDQVGLALGSLPLLGKAVSVYDIEGNKKIYGQNDEVALPIASLAKSMTVAVALGSLDYTDVLPLSFEAISQDGDFGLLLGEKWTAKSLAKLTLIASANDGAYALGEGRSDFLEKMNTKGKKIGMEHTFFYNLTGLDTDAGTPGAYASAQDANFMAMYGLRAHELIFRVTSLPEINLKSESGFSHNFKNTNTIIGKIPNLLFSKTGFTELAGGNLTVIFRNKSGEKIAVTVLGSTFDGRFLDMEKIVEVLSSL